jgi:formylmethanofuran dehydrogenase subunit E
MSGGTPHASATTCHICAEAADAANSAVCNTCGERFHLRLRNDAEGKDCGEVWINEQFLALEFACLSCLGRGDTASQEPPVDLTH